MGTGQMTNVPLLECHLSHMLNSDYTDLLCDRTWKRRKCDHLIKVKYQWTLHLLMCGINTK